MTSVLIVTFSIKWCFTYIYNPFNACLFVVEIILFLSFCMLLDANLLSSLWSFGVIRCSWSPWSFLHVLFHSIKKIIFFLVSFLCLLKFDDLIVSLLLQSPPLNFFVGLLGVGDFIIGVEEKGKEVMVWTGSINMGIGCLMIVLLRSLNDSL